LSDEHLAFAVQHDDTGLPSGSTVSLAESLKWRAPQEKECAAHLVASGVQHSVPSCFVQLPALFAAEAHQRPEVPPAKNIAPTLQFPGLVTKWAAASAHGASDNANAIDIMVCVLVVILAESQE
jgi:hypothetical protein